MFFSARKDNNDDVRLYWQTQEIQKKKHEKNEKYQPNTESLRTKSVLGTQQNFWDASRERKS